MPKSKLNRNKQAFFERKLIRRAKAAFKKNPREGTIIKGVYVTLGNPHVRFGYVNDDFEKNLVTCMMDRPVYFNNVAEIERKMQKFTPEYVEQVYNKLFNTAV